MSDIRFGVLGAAKIDRTTIPAINATEGSCVLAVASRSQEKADAFAQEMELKLAFASYEELLASDQIDAIYVALPIQFHKEWTIKALRAGKAVLCEKSLCIDTADAIEMYAVAKESGNLLHEVMSYRHHPMTQKIQSLVAEGAIGDVKIMHVKQLFNSCSTFLIRCTK